MVVGNMPDLREYTARKKILEEYNSMTNSVLLRLTQLIRQDSRELLGVKEIFKEILNKDNKVFGKPLSTYLSQENVRLMHMLEKRLLAAVQSRYNPTGQHHPASSTNASIKKRPGS